MPSALFEVYVKYNFPSYDARTGHGYGVVNSKSQKERPSVGTQLQKDNFYPYTRPPKEATGNEEDDEETPSKIKRKIVAKIGGPVHINDPFSKNWTDRGAFVNGASRLDLGLAENIFTISDIDSNISPLYSRGGISQILAMGNGAGIYKTKHGKTIGMSNAGKYAALAAKRSQKKVPPSLVQFINLYMKEYDEEA